ncbi:uncharacterized protein RSE6_13458 [Rhynchosporium secalis]|uniref:Uncharacterized protein n=1 Tax=Rhynchosporium secalis TaxID=38038 RepID=A0A1E1MSX5_RHYSE|nr:uncharacterized protein RSE6_13458 [Rhynchosporium secalis]
MAPSPGVFATSVEELEMRTIAWKCLRDFLTIY